MQRQLTELCFKLLLPCPMDGNHGDSALSGLPEPCDEGSQSMFSEESQRKTSTPCEAKTLGLQGHRKRSGEPIFG